MDVPVIIQPVAGEVARAHAHLGEAVVRLGRWGILSDTEAAIARVAQLKAPRPYVRPMDPRIAVAMENQAVVVTRNLRDFNRIPGLSVED